MTKFKLIYFNAKGRAEVFRYMMVLLGIEFEDHRVRIDKWSELKPKIPLGQLPVLEIDGTPYPHSHAHCRYIARECGLYGSSPKDHLDVDVVCETVDDLWPGIHGILIEKDKRRKKELQKKLAEKGAIKHINNLEKLLKMNKDGSGWFVGNKVTLADIMAFNIVHDFVPNVVGFREGELDLKDNNSLKAFVERFKAQQKITDWINKRPQTPL